MGDFRINLGSIECSNGLKQQEMLSEPLLPQADRSFEFNYDDRAGDRKSVRACRRFVRQMGISTKRSYRNWSKDEQQRPEDELDIYSVNVVAMRLPRPPPKFTQ